MLRHRFRRVISACLFACVLAPVPFAARAADLDRPFPGRGPQYWSDNGEFVPAHHGCRLIPEPQLNLWGEVTSYHPMWVCVSRGLYADTFPPPAPPPRPFGPGLW